MTNEEYKNKINELLDTINNNDKLDLIFSILVELKE